MFGAGLAHSVEHITRNDEVIGSIPISSSRKTPRNRKVSGSFLFYYWFQPMPRNPYRDPYALKVSLCLFPIFGMKSPGTGSMILSMYRPLRIPVTMPQTKTKAPTPRGRSCQNSPKYSITPIEGSRGRLAPAHCPSTNAFVSLAITSSSLVGMT